MSLNLIISIGWEKGIVVKTMTVRVGSYVDDFDVILGLEDPQRKVIEIVAKDSIVFRLANFSR